MSGVTCNDQAKQGAVWRLDQEFIADILLLMRCCVLSCVLKYKVIRMREVVMMVTHRDYLKIMFIGSIGVRHHGGHRERIGTKTA